MDLGKGAEQKDISICKYIYIYIYMYSYIYVCIYIYICVYEDTTRNAAMIVFSMACCMLLICRNSTQKVRMQLLALLLEPVVDICPELVGDGAGSDR